MSITKNSAFVNQEACIGCGTCEACCPVAAIKLTNGKAYADSKCVACGACVSACPVECIKIKSNTFDK